MEQKLAKLPDVLLPTESSLLCFLPLVYCVVAVLRPLVYTVSALLPVAYIIGLTFTLKTHSHIYDIHVGEGQGVYLPPKTHTHTHH